jgi:DNA-binding transcriptional regulator of glucitol operon
MTTTEEAPSLSLAPSDEFSRAFKRTPQQVLNVVFGAPGKGVHRGGFFPESINGVVRHT